MRYQYRGAPVIGWKPHEILWLKAALSLPAFEFLEAAEQIAEMSGRTISAVAVKARSLAAKPKPACVPPYPNAKAPILGHPEPWVMRQPTKAQLMAGKAR